MFLYISVKWYIILWNVNMNKYEWILYTIETVKYVFEISKCAFLWKNCFFFAVDCK